MCTVLNVLLLVSFQILICRPQQLWTHSNQLPKDFALTCLQRGKCVTMDMEKLVKLGKEMDLSGNELREFVRGEQEMIRVERKEKEISERDARAQQLELKRQELEVAEIQLELERVKKEHGKSQDDPSTFKGSKPNARIPKLPHFEDNRDELDSYLYNG